MKKFSILSLFAISALMMSFTTKQSKADRIETQIFTTDENGGWMWQNWDDGGDCIMWVIGDTVVASYGDDC